MNGFIESVTNWITNPASWLAPGPIAQMIGLLLVAFSILQSLPKEWAGGKLFTRKRAWITYLITALYVIVVFIIPFVGWKVGIPLLIVIFLLFIALRAKDSWKDEE